MNIQGTPFDLTYCTNIHASNGWEDVFASLRHFAPALKAQFSPGEPFGLGLRLSSLESEQLLEGTRLDEFKAFLDKSGLSVCLLNGFPFGAFHGQRVKEQVFAPDWRDASRLNYTLRLVRILSALLPQNGEGGISTSPLSYKRWIEADDTLAWETMTRQVVRAVEAMARVRRETGQLIHLDIEPEPDGLVETSGELLAFFRDYLLPLGAPMLAGSLGLSLEDARDHLLEHVQVCLDVCHLAIEHEDVEAALQGFDEAGVRVGRVQISSALEVVWPSSHDERETLRHRLQTLCEPTYLHQVIERREDGTLRRFPDLRDALQCTGDELSGRRWRIHFHVPVFAECFGDFGSTQSAIGSTLNSLKRRAWTRHLEIETYTWEVLPPAWRVPLDESIAREYRWVLEQFEGG